ncbi:MAG: ComEC/Rec2 family competence protein [Verrucomicrobiota bacterium]
MRFFEPESLSNPRSPLSIGLIATLLGYLIASENQLWVQIDYALLIAWTLSSLCALVFLKDRTGSSILWFLLIGVFATIRYEGSQEVNPGRHIPNEAPPREITVNIQILKIYGLPEPSQNTRGIALTFKTPIEQSYFEKRKVYFDFSPKSAADLKVREGQTFKIKGVVSPLTSNRFSKYLSKIGVSHRLQIDSASPISVDEFGLRSTRSFLSYLRYHWIDRLNHHFAGSPDTAAVLIALSLGDTRYLSESVHRSFFETGTLHIFAISGLHILAIFMMLKKGARILRIPKNAATTLAVSLTGTFILITGSPPSALRAFAILIFFYVGRIAQRRQQSFATLVACALFYLWLSPSAFHSLGFALSFSVVAAILLIGIPLIKIADRWMLEFEAPRPSRLVKWYRRRIKRGFVNSFCISLAAFIGSAPWILANFGAIAPFGILTNTFVVFVGMLTLFSIIIIAPLVVIFPKASTLLEIPGIGANIAIFITDSWSTWPIMIRLNRVADPYHLPLLCIMTGLGYLYFLRVRLVPIKLVHLAIACTPAIIYGLSYSWQLKLLGQLP